MFFHITIPSKCLFLRNYPKKNGTNFDAQSSKARGIYIRVFHFNGQHDIHMVRRQLFVAFRQESVWKQYTLMLHMQLINMEALTSTPDVINKNSNVGYKLPLSSLRDRPACNLLQTTCNNCSSMKIEGFYVPPAPWQHINCMTSPSMTIK